MLIHKSVSVVSSVVEEIVEDIFEVISLSKYERIRMFNMKRNRACLLELGFIPGHKVVTKTKRIKRSPVMAESIDLKPLESIPM